ncbi:Bifunctional protein HldE [Candidatus Entotheonellaceae bacterium PAL068K]
MRFDGRGAPPQLAIGRRQKQIDTVRKFSQIKVVVLGDVMLDVYDFCATEASKPIPSEKPGKRAYKVQPSLQTLGGAGNVAANLAALGVTTALIGLTGHDGHAFTLQALADGLGLHHCLIRDASRPTTTKIRLYLDNEYLLRRDDEATHKASAALTEAMRQAFRRALAGAAAVILSDYDKGLFTTDLAQDIISTCGHRGIPVIVDMKPPNQGYFTGADIIAPNVDEAAVLQPGLSQHTLCERQVRALYERLACHNLVVTLGDRGICGYDGQAVFHAPAYSVDAVDAVGCGDTVRVGIALGLALGLSLPEAAGLANAAAAVVVQKTGTSTLTQQELIAFLRHQAS